LNVQKKAQQANNGVPDIATDFLIGGWASRSPSDYLLMNRIAVIGTTGSGKSTLARQLAQKLACSCVDLDDLGWDANWVMPPDAVLRKRVDDALRPNERWITSGNRAIVRDLIWGRADTLVWLDYAFPIVLWRLTTRTLRRIATQETVCNGNHETWRDVFWVHPRNTLFYFAFKTHWRRRREMPLLLAQPEHQHLALVRLRSQRDAAEWLALA
jgi:adenylate kinase family enzyme